jgi:hypothetical protein
MLHDDDQRGPTGMPGHAARCLTERERRYEVIEGKNTSRSYINTDVMRDGSAMISIPGVASAGLRWARGRQRTILNASVDRQDFIVEDVFMIIDIKSAVGGLWRRAIGAQGPSSEEDCHLHLGHHRDVHRRERLHDHTLLHQLRLRFPGGSYNLLCRVVRIQCNVMLLATS